MKKSKKLAKNRNLSFRRRVVIYYHRTVLLLKISSLLLVGLFLFTDIFKGVKNNAWNLFYQQSTNNGFVLEKIILEGPINTPYEDIIAAIDGDTGTPIFAINMHDVKDRLEAHSWVKSAIIERQLPSTLYIAITERTPLAIWQFKQKLYIIDEEGNRISKYNNGFSNLVQVVGNDANIYAKHLIDELNAYPELATNVRSAVRMGNRRWDLHLDQNIIVKMPENKFSAAYRYLHSLNKANKLFDQNYKMLDLRDPEKFYLEKL
ncbi:MAG: FtsQ-type POTRA domain-containing protein [Rickettsiaceae bacterium]|nr:FtsQ-type POTRA domain-containing protein [Rickettsiaceae bacterium]